MKSREYILRRQELAEAEVQAEARHKTEYVRGQLRNGKPTCHQITYTNAVEREKLLGIIEIAKTAGRCGRVLNVSKGA